MLASVQCSFFKGKGIPLPQNGTEIEILSRLDTDAHHEHT